MADQETYDRTLDAPAALEGSALPTQPRPLPDEEYYRGAPEPRRGGRAGLGIALLLVGLLLLAALLLGRGLSFGGGGSATLVDQTLPGSRIELSTSSGDVQVRTWRGPDIRVEVTQQGGSSGEYTVDVSRAGDTVRVVESSRGMFCIFCSGSLRYQISVPDAAQADIKTASGEIDVVGLGGAVALSTVSGDVRAEDLAGGLTVGTTSGEVRLNDVAGQLSVTSISGDVKLEDGKVDGAAVKTTSGEIDLSGVGGALDLGSVSGDISAADARDGRLTVATTSGGIRYDGSLARGGANQISSISGEVRLRLPAESGFRLETSTVSGDLESEFDLSGGATSRGALSGVAGDGGATLNISTTSGDIRIERR